MECRKDYIITITQMNYKTLKEIRDTEKAIHRALLAGATPRTLEESLKVKFLVFSDGFGEIQGVEVVEFL